jgi:hypothetical protein
MKHKYPIWFEDPARVEHFLEVRFPATWDICPNMVRRIACNCKQCQKHEIARRWKIVINRYFVKGQSDHKIETEHRWEPGTVGSIVQKIRRALDKKRSDGKPWSFRKPGRPKKTADNFQKPKVAVSDLTTMT